MIYEEALNGAKVGEFLKRGLKVTGVIHIGSNDGYEVPFYQGMGISNIICFEPLKSAQERFRQKNPGVMLIPCGLSDQCVFSQPMTVSEGDGQGTTFLKSLNDDTAFGSYKTHLERGMLNRLDLIMTTLGGRNCIVIDTQGMELQVLKGFGKLIDEVDCAVIECSRVPIYEGEAPAHEVIEWMDAHEFDSITPISDHDDILFVRRK